MHGQLFAAICQPLAQRLKGHDAPHLLDGILEVDVFMVIGKDAGPIRFPSRL
jgi:hypothetical protein